MGPPAQYPHLLGALSLVQAMPICSQDQSIFVNKTPKTLVLRKLELMVLALGGAGGTTALGSSRSALPWWLGKSLLWAVPFKMEELPHNGCFKNQGCPGTKIS